MHVIFNSLVGIPNVALLFTPLYRRTESDSFIQTLLCIYIPILYYSISTFSPLRMLYTPHLFSAQYIPIHPRSASCDHKIYLKQFTSSNGSLLPHICSTHFYILIAPYNYVYSLALSSFAYTTKLILQSTCTTSLSSQPLVLYHLQIKVGLTQTCHHSYAADPVLSRGLERSHLAPHHPYAHYKTMETSQNCPSQSEIYR